MASLMARAPWLPPNTNSVGWLPGGFCGIWKKAGRTGTPVTWQFGKYLQVSSKWTAAADTQCATIRLAKPGTTFGSKAIVETPRRMAAAMAGPEAYPPTPMTTSGWNWASMRREFQMARGRSREVFRRVARLTFLSAPTCTRRSSNPAAGTRRFSMPRGVPMKSNSAARDFLSSWAMASAGMTCPPVPPPARTTRILRLSMFAGRLSMMEARGAAGCEPGASKSGRLSVRQARRGGRRVGRCWLAARSAQLEALPSLGLLRNIEKHAYAPQHHEQRGSAVG